MSIFQIIGPELWYLLRRAFELIKSWFLNLFWDFGRYLWSFCLQIFSKAFQISLLNMLIWYFPLGISAIILWIEFSTNKKKHEIMFLFKNSNRFELHKNWFKEKNSWGYSKNKQIKSQLVLKLSRILILITLVAIYTFFALEAHDFIK